MLDIGPASFQCHLEQCCFILHNAFNFTGRASDMQNGSYSDLALTILVVQCKKQKGKKYNSLYKLYFK